MSCSNLSARALYWRGADVSHPFSSPQQQFSKFFLFTFKIWSILSESGPVPWEELKWKWTVDWWDEVEVALLVAWHWDERRCWWGAEKGGEGGPILQNVARLPLSLCAMSRRECKVTFFLFLCSCLSGYMDGIHTTRLTVSNKLNSWCVLCRLNY